MTKTIFKYLYASLVIATCCACKKSVFLEAKPDEALVVPTSLKDFQALMDNDLVMNGAGNQGVLPALGEVASDDYYLLDADYNGSMQPIDRNCYSWAKALFNGEEIYDWDYPYRAIFYANIVLDGLGKLKTGGNDQSTVNNLTGTALFHRANMIFALSQVFAAPYDQQTAAASPGVPLRLKSDINEPIVRSTTRQTFDQLLADLNRSVTLLPVKPLYKSRPSKPAAYGLLSRVYLSMREYGKALLYADSSLQLQSNLMDYNKLTPGSGNAIPLFNNEVIFNCTLIPRQPLNYGYADTMLYRSYSTNDLRKAIFFGSFNGLYYFTGSYNGNYSPFGGIAVDEMLLNRAEGYARAGNSNAALSDLNMLLASRWKTGSFVQVTTTGPDDALKKILSERRKELLFRGLRWIDLRRLNKEPAFAVQPKRIIGGKTYDLPPNDPRYTFPIPDNVIKLHPEMPQNPR